MPTRGTPVWLAAVGAADDALRVADAADQSARVSAGQPRRKDGSGLPVGMLPGSPPGVTITRSVQVATGHDRRTGLPVQGSISLVIVTEADGTVWARRTAIEGEPPSVATFGWREIETP